jgi:hypothetical protein
MKTQDYKLSKDVLDNMDASKIIEYKQRQANRYVHRSQTVDSSTLTWKSQMQASRYINNTPLPKPNCTTSCSAGQGRVQLYANSNPVQNSTIDTSRPDPRYGIGSATKIYSAQMLTQQKVGNQLCGAAPVSDSPYITLPCCDDTTSYLPTVDTYYFSKNKEPCSQPDTRHFVPAYKVGCSQESEHILN